MKYISIGVLISIVLLAGCSTLPPVQPTGLNKQSITEQKETIKIGIFSTETSTPSVAFPGADCLLCIAFASGANSELSGHIKSLESDVGELDNLLLDELKKQGFNARLITEALNLKDVEKINVKKEQTYAARRDFRPLAKQHGLTHVLVFDIRHHGVVRPYASYVATSAPYAAVSGTAYMIDIASNQYVWNTNIEQKQNAKGQWQTPPTYPELTNAYYSVVEAVKENVLEAFDFEKH